MNKLIVLTVPKESPRSNTTPCSDSGAISLRYILILSPFPHHGNQVLFLTKLYQILTFFQHDVRTTSCHWFNSRNTKWINVIFCKKIQFQPRKNTVCLLRTSRCMLCRETATVCGEKSCKVHEKICGKNAEFVTLNATARILTTKPWSANHTHNITRGIRISVLLKEQFLPTYCYVNILRVNTLLTILLLTNERTFTNQTPWIPKFVIAIAFLYKFSSYIGGPGSVVGIATAYSQEGLGIESRWGRDFTQLSRPALRPTQPPVQ
jgi:hypothetical protein